MKRLERLERLELSAAALRLVRSARVARFATADRKGKPLVVPICYAFDGNNFYTPIDEKPKRALPRRLQRMRNIRENPDVSIVIDRYDENWQRLAYVLVAGKARILTRGKKHRQAVSLLRRKYAQYRRMAIDKRPMIEITPVQFKSWGNP